ncbi:MAG: YgjV family protein [Alphaproteobacteria bacterium]
MIEALNLHPIITPLLTLSSVIYIASFWAAERNRLLELRVFSNLLIVVALAVADLWTGAVIAAVSGIAKASAIYTYTRFSTRSKIALVLVSFIATVLLQDRALMDFEYLPLVAFLYGRSLEQFAANRHIRIAGLPVQVLYLFYFAFAGRWDGVILEAANTVANLYTWVYRRDKLAA